MRREQYPRCQPANRGRLTPRHGPPRGTVLHTTEWDMVLNPLHRMPGPNI